MVSRMLTTLHTTLRAGLVLAVAAAGMSLVSVTAGVATAAPAAAKSRAKAVSRVISLRTSATTLTGPARLTIAGNVSRSPRGSIVYLQRYTSGHWGTWKTVHTTTSTGTFSWAFTTADYGTRYYRAYAPTTPSRHLRAAVSGVHKVAVYRRTAATLTASATTPTTGDPITLTGAAAPFRAGTAVTLQRLTAGVWRTDGASTRVSSTGRYTFTRAAVVGTTTYRVVVSKTSTYLAAAASPAVTVSAKTPPAPPAPAVILTREATTTPGSAITPDLTPELTSVQTLTTAPEAPLSASVDDQGQLAIAASTTAQAGQQTLTIAGTGCDTTGCKRSFRLTLTLAVIPLATKPALTDVMTQPSPDRIENPVTVDGDIPALADEVLLVLAPGTAPARARTIATNHGGGTVTAAFTDIGVYELRWPTRQNITTLTTELEDESDVRSASPSTLTPVSTTAVAPSEWSDPTQSSYGWALRMIHAPDAWETTTGNPDIAVGIIDTGTVATRHPDLNATTATPSLKAEDHATEVASAACARANGAGTVGVSWGCPIVSAGLTSTVGVGSQVLEPQRRLWKNVLSAARAVITDPRVRVANMSLGIGTNTCASDSELATITNLRQAIAPVFAPLFSQGHGRDILWTLSAGNNCTPQPDSPMGWWAQDPNVITVASVNADGRLSSFSNYGEDVEVAAPGGLSLDNTTGLRLATANGGYTDDIGTSFAAPLVAGIAQLAFSANPVASASAVGRCINTTADTPVTARSPLPRSYNPRNLDDRGPSLVDAGAVVACAKGPTQITTTTLPNAQVGQPYTIRLTTADNRPGLWGATGLPAGIYLDGDTISGTPTQAGTAAIDITFDDGANTLTQHATLVTEAKSPETMSTLTSGEAGRRYSARLTTAEGRQGQWAIGSGALPDGLTLAGDTITGTPTVQGNYDFTAQFDGATGAVARKFSLYIRRSRDFPCSPARPRWVDDLSAQTSQDQAVVVSFNSRFHRSTLCSDFSFADWYTDTLTLLPANSDAGAVISNNGKTLTSPGEGVYTADDDGNITFTPARGFTGTARIKYEISDGVSYELRDGVEPNERSFATASSARGIVEITVVS